MQGVLVPAALSVRSQGPAFSVAVVSEERLAAPLRLASTAALRARKPRTPATMFRCDSRREGVSDTVGDSIACKGNLQWQNHCLRHFWTPALGYGARRKPSRRPGGGPTLSPRRIPEARARPPRSGPRARSRSHGSSTAATISSVKKCVKRDVRRRDLVPYLNG